MKSWNLLTLKNSQKWSELIDQCEQSDIHFTPEYLRIFEKKIGGKAILFVEYSKDKKNYVIYPFFKRKINDLDIFSSIKKPIYDIISPWYFGGPLMYSNENQQELLKSFFKNFHSYVKDNFIVTEFTRIHPLLNASKVFEKIFKANYRYDVSYVDLTQSKEKIWNNFSKSNRNSINASIRRGVKVQFSNRKDTLKKFYDLYIDTMKRIGADDFYFFSFEFFEELLDSLKNNMIIATSFYEEKPISSSILLFKSGIVHYWLSGSDLNYKNLFPNNLLLYESIKWSKEKKNRIFILMGGSSKGLRKFKESFSQSKTGFYTINKIYEPKIFSHLNSLRKKDEKAINLDFFPPYRS